MIPYVLHVTVLITACFLFYKLLLQKQTFYQLNRWTLLLCLAVSFTLPFLPLPPGWSLGERLIESSRRGVAEDPASREYKTGRQTLASNQTNPIEYQPEKQVSQTEANPATPNHKEQGQIFTHESYDQISIETPTAHLSDETRTAHLSDETPTAHLSDETPTAHLSGVQIQVPAKNRQAGSVLVLAIKALFYAYFIGLFLFGGRFLLEIAVLYYQSHTQPVTREGQFRIVATAGNRAPCSFGNTIFINPAIYDAETYQQILLHEKVHVSGRHTLDIIAAELAVVLQWFNPAAWLYRREVENNLEFLTDRAVLLHREVEPLTYQLSLLRVSAPHLSFSITNNYNQSLLKRRIVMMNSQRSPRLTVWKYFFLIPLLTVFVCLLNKPIFARKTKDKAIRSDRPGLMVAASRQVPTDTTIRPLSGAGPEQIPAASATSTQAATRSVIAVDIPNPAAATSSLQTLPAIGPVATLRSLPATGSDAPPVSVAATSTIEPAMDIAVSDPVGSVDVRPNLNLDIHVQVDRDSFPSEGSWFITTKGDRLQIEFRAGDEDHSWNNSFTVDKSEINPFPGQGAVEFKLTREAGTVDFKGQFDGQQGFGHFVFQPDQAYIDALKQMGVEDIGGYDGMSLFSLNIKKEYVAMLQRNGYTPIHRHEVISVAAMHIDEAYLKSMKAAGYNQLNIHELISLKALHIDGQYAKTMNAGNNGTLIPPHELISYKAMNIDPDYISSFQKIGYTDLSRHDLMTFKSMGITAGYVKEFEDAGFKNIAPHTFLAFKSMGVTSDYARAFHDLGYTDIEMNRLVSLKAMGVTPDFVKEFHKIGYDHIPINLLTSLKAMGIDAAFVSKMKEKGFNSDDLRKYMRLKQDFKDFN